MATYAIVIQGEVVTVAQMDIKTVDEVRALIASEPFIAGQVVSVDIETERYRIIAEVEAAIDTWRL